ncbi:alanine racemase [Nocardioides zeae]|uniref:Alanine racemase n=1 Tax=Nocardioides imazamoxiresistens TaxID=3231893 RepID=A0ABU3PTY6_9ACTN|nr:alanine racemase [Nocardioides zeae]MDT9592661.1 alanine racemase [Nocardioides zeae]
MSTVAMRRSVARPATRRVPAADDDLHRRVPVLTVDLGAVAANVRLLAARAAASGAATAAVVKADGFGLGAADVARTALAHGASRLGVTSIDEALALRAAGLDAPVLSWLNAVDADFGSALDADVELALPSTAHLAAVVRAWRARARRAPALVHLHLDTGLARDGAAPEEWAALCLAARRAERDGTVRAVGVMGHLPDADAGPLAAPGADPNAAGRDRFAAGLDEARAGGLRPALRHLAATAATLRDPATHHTLVRVGAGVVGIDPSETTPLAGPVTLTAPVVTVREVTAGTPVGYGGTWRAPAPTRLALLAVGYADGLPRTASGRAEVLLGGRRVPVVGRISMDQVVVDLGPGDPGLRVAPGDVATVMGPPSSAAPTVQEWARWSGLLPHEVLTGLGTRPRRTVLPAPSDPSATRSHP